MSENRWRELLQLLASQTELETFEWLLSLLLSHDERQSIAGRLAIIKALLIGEQSQRQISAELGISIATITRASNNLKNLSASELAQLKQLLNVDNANTMYD
ncbi:trp operon repressor [Ferrimonas senticii]|uniref:trp operon repressor n=1 Tax=Ferrimonas senticii TaxID=394566 RepID=UPI000422633C|nr:trp operon repressor [Ferrimonas senticii]